MGCGASAEQQAVQNILNFFEAVHQNNFELVQDSLIPRHGFPALVPVDILNPIAEPRMGGDSTEAWTALILASRLGHEHIVEYSNPNPNQP